jgi:hypothetical protein
MFYEIMNVRQIEGEPKRRWFVDGDLELIIWLGEGDRIVGFQLCYEKEKVPKALTWQEDKGFLHSGIDDGDLRGYPKPTPILIRDGVFDKKNVEKKFAASSVSLPKEIADFVKAKLAEFPGA